MRFRVNFKIYTSLAYGKRCNRVQISLRCLTKDGPTCKLCLTLSDVKRHVVRLHICQHYNLKKILWTSLNFFRVKMSSFRRNKRHMRELFSYFYNLDALIVCRNTLWAWRKSFMPTARGKYTYIAKDSKTIWRRLISLGMIQSKEIGFHVNWS